MSTENQTTQDAKEDSLSTEIDEILSESKESLKKDSDENKSEKEKSSDNGAESKDKKILIIEFAIVIVALIAILVAVLMNKNGDNTVSGNEVSQNTTVSAPTSVVDNSALYTDIPAFPAADAYNTLTEEECEANVAAGTMIRIDNADGSYVYVNNYTDAEYFLAETSYTQEEVDEYILFDILFYYAENVETTRTVCQKWDSVSVNFVGTIDGEVFEGGSAENYNILLGEGQFIDGFEDGIIGMEVGETKDIYLTFPEDYAEDLAGKDVVFTITLNSIISETVFPELTDEMVTECFGGELTTVEECYEYYEEIMVQDKIWSFIDSGFYTSTLPEETITNYYNTTMEYYDALSVGQGMDIATMLSYYGLTLDLFKSDVMKTSGESARYSMLYSTIAADAGLTITDEDIATLATDYGYTDTALFIEDYGQQNINDYILQSKVMDYMISLRQ